MDKKKLIGTIVGVIMFALLIAGATYAWLTLNVTVTNGTYNTKTKNFVINYVGGQSIKNTVQTSNPTTTVLTQETNVSVATDGWVAVKASKPAATAKASDFSIKLHITNNEITSSALSYAVCKGNCPENVPLATISDGFATCARGVASCGMIAGNQSNKDIVLYTELETEDFLDD